MEIPITLPQNKLRSWDLDIPYTVDGNVTTVYLTEAIDAPVIYNELCYLLAKATKEETFILKLNTPGGIIDSAIMLVDALKNTKANTVASLSGTVASAGTMIALACTDMSIAPFTGFMIHNYSGGMVGKGHEMKAQQAFVDANLEELFTAVYLGFLSSDECKEVIDGKDLWMGAEEVSIRWTTKDAPQRAPKKRGRPKKVKA